ncbi:MAG: type I-D CRISPR-associated helicase Cas3' [Desulfobacteraceae bacterium]|jgi:CRISPR-associated helicase Cas3
MIKILPLALQQVNHPETRIDLYPHQAVMLDEWDKHKTFLLVTKTGTGKTIGAVMPLFKKMERAILVYPTNELIRDQVSSIAGIAELEGLKPCVFTPETSKEEYSGADVVLVHIDAAALQAWDKKKHLGGKWAALKYLLAADKKVKLILTNPDILFLILALRYRAEPLASLQAYPNLIVDEFHLYQGVEFAHALFMIHLARNLGMFERVVLLSATPHKEVREYLDRMLDPFVIDLKTESSREVKGERVATHAVEVSPVLSGPDVVEDAIFLIKEIQEKLYALRKENLSKDYIPAVVVLNSVVNAIRLEDRLVDEGFKRDELLIIRGLSSRGIRQKDENKILAIGTSAIEVGIDFKCDYLIFEAGEAASFMQRFGRVGRHKPGTAYVLCNPNVKLGMEKLPSGIDRGNFEEYIYEWYASLSSRPWFVETKGGMITAYSLANSIVSNVAQDRNASEKAVNEVRDRMDEIALSYANILGMEKIFNSVKAQFLKAEKGVKAYQWLKAYRDLNTFRTSMPSEMVCDFAEKERRDQEWETAKYSVDMVTLLKRAEGLRFNEKIPNPDGDMGMLTVKGYGRYKKVWVMPTFEDEDCGIIKVTGDYPELTFLQEGHKTSVSHVMTLKDHIFVVIPKELKDAVDWRLPVFECGRHMIAFDGAALLLNEIWQQNYKQDMPNESF